MKKISILAVLLFLFVSFVGASETGNVALVYNGFNAVNKEVIQFFRKETKKLGSQHTFKRVSVFSDINIDDYTDFIVINTGMEMGIDPELADFINSSEDKSRIILLSLLTNSTDFTVQSFGASDETSGVDAISAASLWEYDEIVISDEELEDMHHQWLSLVLQEIDRKS